MSFSFSEEFKRAVVEKYGALATVRTDMSDWGCPIIVLGAMENEAADRVKGNKN